MFHSNLWWNGDSVSNRYNKKLIFACRIVQQANPPSLMKPNNNVINAYILNVPSKSCHHTHSTSLTHVSRLLTHMLEKNAHMSVRLCLLVRTRICQHNEAIVVKPIRESASGQYKKDRSSFHSLNALVTLPTQRVS